MVRTDSTDRPRSRKPAQQGKRTSHKVKTTSTSKIRQQQSATYLNTRYDLPRSACLADVDEKELVGENLYDVVPSRRDDQQDSVYVNMNAIYENVAETSQSALDIYDLPRPTKLAQTDPTYRNVKPLKRTRKSGQRKQKTRQVYDIPRPTLMPVYDVPLELKVSEGTEYDYPKNLIPLSTSLLLPVNSNRSELHQRTDLQEIHPPAKDLLTESGIDESAEIKTLGLNKNAESQSTSADEGISELDIKSLDLNQDSEEAISANEINNDYVNLAWSSSGGKLPDVVGNSAAAAAAAAQCRAANTPGRITSQDSSTKGKDRKNLIGRKPAAQRDRSIEVYNETIRQRNNSRPKMSVKEVAVFQVVSAKEDVDKLSTIRRMRKLLPSVRALRTQFESSCETRNSKTTLNPARKWKSSSTFQDSGDVEPSSKCHSSSLGSLDDISSYSSSSGCSKDLDQCASGQGDSYVPRPTTCHWDPTVLLKELYGIPEVVTEAGRKEQIICVDLQGYLEKLPSGRRKATFWNAWKRRFFKLENGSLYCYHHNESENAAVVMHLSGGTVQNMDDTMICVEDTKGRHMVIRGSSNEETRRWYRALQTHINYPRMCSFIEPCSLPRQPGLFKDTIVIDIGSCSIRAGILSSQPTLPQVFFPSVGAMDKSTGAYTAFGMEALLPESRSKSKLVFPLRLSNRISKMAVDFAGLSGLIRSAFQQLNVIPSDYRLQVSIPRRLNVASRNELVKMLFDEFRVKSVHLAHQAVLSLLSYDVTSGIVVDIGERMDIVPIKDGYIVEAGVFQVPYGGLQLTDHMRPILNTHKCSLLTEVESYLIRYAVENSACVAGPDRSAYLTEMAKYRADPSSLTATLELSRFGDLPWKSVSLGAGRFQVAEGLFRPEAWGLDNESVPKLVLRSIRECAVDVRKDMAQSIYLSGGVTLLEGFPRRLQTELGQLKHLSPTVNASPYRYHAAYIGACVQANSADYEESSLTLREWETNGVNPKLQWAI